MTFRALAIVSLLVACADVSPPALTRIMEAHRLTDTVRAELSSAASASDRAVMADTASSQFAQEARRTTAQVDKDLRALEALITGLAFAEEGLLVSRLRTDFDKYRALERDVLELALENSNARARRLSFGPAHQAADQLQAALDPVARAGSPSAALALRAALAVRQIEVLTAPHIAAREDGVMNDFEQQMDELRVEAHASLGELEQDKDTHAAAVSAQTALTRFEASQAEIVQLSRRNSNLRSLALSLGEKLQLVSSCRQMLDQLSRDLDSRASPATR